MRDASRLFKCRTCRDSATVESHDSDSRLFARENYRLSSSRNARAIIMLLLRAQRSARPRVVHRRRNCFFWIPSRFVSRAATTLSESGREKRTLLQRNTRRWSHCVEFSAPPLHSVFVRVSSRVATRATLSTSVSELIFKNDRRCCAQSPAGSGVARPLM